MKSIPFGMGLALALGLSACAMQPDTGGHGQHQHHTPSMQAAAPSHAHAATEDTRQLVNYPEPLRIHTLSNMRDHLRVLGEIQAALAIGSFDKASELAEQGLGMSSLAMHGAHEVAKYMPQGMQDAGTAMHHSASRLALVAKDASATGEIRPVLAAMVELNRTCVACHAAYRLQ